MSDKQEYRFPCSECGSDLEFTPGTDHLTCDHCGAENALPVQEGRTDHLAELDFDAAVAAGAPGARVEETRLSKCNECGAEIVFDEQVHATECAFCGATLVTDTGTSRRIKPAALLPFLKTEKEARAAMSKWLGRLWFAPSGLQQYARKGRAMQGIYVPFWTYDASTRSRYSGQRGTVYYETRTRQVQVNGKMETRQERIERVRWIPVSGHVARDFDDVLVLAAQGLAKSHTDALAPWDLEALKPYDPAYLAGFRAEGYTVNLETGYIEARHHMDRVINGDVRRDIGGDRQRVGTINTSVSDVTFKHILLPIWMAAYKFKGKTFHFVVNGRTGKVKGQRPYSALKIAFTVITAVIVIGTLAWYFSQNG